MVGQIVKIGKAKLEVLAVVDYRLVGKSWRRGVWVSLLDQHGRIVDLPADDLRKAVENGG
jgi:hypothetical protein